MTTDKQQFTAFVKYGIPSRSELEHQFPDYVDQEYEYCAKGLNEDVRLDLLELLAVNGPEIRATRADNLYCGFNPSEYIEHVSREPRDVTFECFKADKDSIALEVRIALEKNGLRPAIFTELLGFVKRYPDEARNAAAIVALGSRAYGHVGGYKYVYTSIVGNDRRLFLGTGQAMSKECSFLAVRK